MTRYKLLTAIVLFCTAVSLSAQNYEDILRYSQPQYMGTARSMAMGSAFGSLGGDFSALGINPAGIAVYRTSEFTFTPSLIFNASNSNLEGNVMNDNKTTFSLNQVGYVGTYRPMREVSKGVVSTHFGIGYNRNNNFNFKSMASAFGLGTSMTDMFRTNAYGLDPGSFNENFPNQWDPLDYKTGLAFGTFLIDKDEEDANGKQTYSSFLEPTDLVDQNRLIERDGYSGELSLTGGVNISHVFLLGASLNFHSLNYEERSYYLEQFSSNNPDNGLTFKHFSVEDRLNVSGNGVSLKVGAIVKPIENLRIGAAYHSPIWYKIEEDYETVLNVDFFNPIPEIDNDKTGLNYIGQYDYRINTPEKLIGSVSYIIGKTAILSLDYERMNYGIGKFKSTNNNINEINDFNIKNNDTKRVLTSTNNIRAGAEFKLNDFFSLRGGYSLQGSPFDKTPKDYEITSISGGLGYRNKNYFIDLAYRNSSYDINYYNYTLPDASMGTLPQTRVETTDHYATLTLGWKF